MIPAAKLRGLRDALERYGQVKFKNGAGVELGHREVRKFMWESPQVIPFLTVTRPAGGISRYGFDDAGLRRAYAMALEGPPAKEQPQGDPDQYGDVPF